MKVLKYFFFFILFCFLALCLRPVPTVTAKNVRSHTGVVRGISEGGVKDAVFHLEYDEHLYYINRGLENKFKLENLKELLIGKEVTFIYAEHWTPLDWTNKSTHIAKLKLGDEILYDEINGNDKSNLGYTN